MKLPPKILVAFVILASAYVAARVAACVDPPTPASTAAPSPSASAPETPR
ncbi:MAG: hypothetical protein ACHREM_02300 [Polyangiales bacterium]